MYDLEVKYISVQQQITLNVQQIFVIFKGYCNIKASECECYLDISVP